MTGRAAEPDPSSSRSPFLLRPLWRLGAGELRRQRCELVLALPFAGVGGLAFGILWSRQLGGEPWELGALGAAGFVVLVYLQVVLTPPVAHLLGRAFGEEWEPLGELVWDGISGGVAAFAATRLLGLGMLPAVGLAGALGALYAVVLPYAVCGGGVSALVGLLTGLGGRGSRRKSDYSYPASLADRGRLDEALAEYERLLEADPSSPDPYLLAARLCRQKLEDYGEEVRWLERAREAADLTPTQEMAIGRRLVDVWRVDLGRPRKAAPELARLAEAFPDTGTGAWARRELRDLKAEMAREMGVEPEKGEEG